MYKYKFICKKCKHELIPSESNGDIAPTGKYLNFSELKFPCINCRTYHNGYSNIETLIEKE